jgi:hypothetical protein
MLMFEDGKIDYQLAITHHHRRCEVGQTLQGGYCELAGEAGFKGLFLCKRHLRQLEAQDRVVLLEGIVGSLELCLSSIVLRKNKGLSIVLRAQRAQAIRELAQADEDLRRAKEEEIS